MEPRVANADAFPLLSVMLTTLLSVTVPAREHLPIDRGARYGVATRVRYMDH